MKNRGLPIVSLAGRITVFLFIFTMYIVLLYVQGSFQNFTDDSLLKLLILGKYSSLVYIAVAASYIFILVTAGRDTGRRLSARIILTLAGCLVSSVIFVLIQIVLSGLEPLY